MNADVGGNCELTTTNEVIKTENGVTIVGIANLPGQISNTASMLFSNNMTTFVYSLILDGELKINLDNNIFSGFELYGGLDALYSMFANEILLLIFWLHFLSISLFAGAWIVRDARKYFIPKIITIPSLVITYFSGPIGLVIYWFFRIFFAKKISFND